jgi:nucleotide-binding universal stress UspA family protein
MVVASGRHYRGSMFSSIVVGTDGSGTASYALEQAIRLAAAHGATLELVTAYEPVPKARLRAEAAEAPEDMQWAINPSEEADLTLNSAREAATAAGVEARVHARDGDPADAILDVAEHEGADLIVVGNKGMTGTKRFLLGSVPNKISHHAPCSVLIVRTV